MSDQHLDLIHRIAALEAQINQLYQHLGLMPPPNAPLRTNLGQDVVAELARQGNKIEAIKAYRELTGAGLAEAKDYVDNLG